MRARELSSALPREESKLEAAGDDFWRTRCGVQRERATLGCKVCLFVSSGANSRVRYSQAENHRSSRDGLVGGGGAAPAAAMRTGGAAAQDGSQPSPFLVSIRVVIFEHKVQMSVETAKLVGFDSIPVRDASQHKCCDLDQNESESIAS